jgi:hypothetical protein
MFWEFEDGLTNTITSATESARAGGRSSGTLSDWAQAVLGAQVCALQPGGADGRGR